MSKKFFAIVVLLLFDGLTLFGSIQIAQLVRTLFLGEEAINFELFEPIVFYFSILFLFVYEKIYTHHIDFWEETRRILKGLALSFLLVTAVLVLTSTALEYSRFVLVGAYLLLLIMIPTQKRLVKYFLTKTGLWRKNIALIGNIEQVEHIKKEIQDNWYLGLFPSKKARAVIIATEGFSREKTQEIANDYLLNQKEVFFVPTLSDINFANANIIELYNIRLSIIGIENKLENPFAKFIKAVFEYTLVIISLPFILLFFGAISACIKLDSKGPIFFIQTRLGRDRVPFKCLKFRSMYLDGDDLLAKYLSKNPEEMSHYEKYHKYKNDPRITPIGRILRKLSIDELPQLINVLRSEMSLIGPRPYMISEQNKLESHDNTILLVKPGITGLWQVSGRNALDFQARINLDKWYIQNWSLWLDLIILIKTIKVVLLGRDAR